MRVVSFISRSINWKLIAPSVAIILIIILLVYFLASVYLEKTVYSSSNKRANEIAEIINISVEADSSLANISRTTHSVANFEDINELYIIDPEKQYILASSNYYLAKHYIKDVKEIPVYKILLRAVQSDVNHFYQREKSNYIYNYSFNVREITGWLTKNYC